MTSTWYCALLRGITPGKPNMRNEKLRGVFDGMGFTGVASVLSSGNIVFAAETTDTTALEGRIRGALRGELGIGGETIVRSRSELVTLVDTEPFGELQHARETYLTATFLKEPLEPVPEPFPEPDEPAVRIVGYDPGARAVLAVSDNTSSSSPDFMAWLERRFGKDITTRTWLTVHRILKRMPDCA
ncbi:hypothetical protein GCM10009676_22740 [Prauserella halophila]|uniref:DUF1697 domain-containing protein n=1 Tax=Prauserella halophila TaxID=185641 RepID=A0ABP4GUF0_9PSEU|nr:DUF1697 domain-containing protein [Prauserella halophila]MCP2235535.1 Uncharacterized conserved protein, DUF1697 family [Prauserella halophila]